MLEKAIAWIILSLALVAGVSHSVRPRDSHVQTPNPPRAPDVAVYPSSTPASHVGEPPAVALAIGLPTATPVRVARSTGRSYAVRLKVSNYCPYWGGPNCAIFDYATAICVRVNSEGECTRWMGDCKSDMAYTSYRSWPWRDWLFRGCACPQSVPSGSVVEFADGRKCVCLDHGGSITITVTGEYWVDLLTCDTRYWVKPPYWEPPNGNWHKLERLHVYEVSGDWREIPYGQVVAGRITEP